MKISGLLIASDGENKKGVIDFMDAPFYGGIKLLLRDKILSPNLVLANGEPLISAPLQAMFDSQIIHDVVVVARRDQCESLEGLAVEYAGRKPLRVVENEGHIGETVARGSETIQIPGHFFILQPDLPFVSGTAIDAVITDILSCQETGISIYLPLVDRDFFNRYGGAWPRTFFVNLQDENQLKRYRMLDFVIADSKTINPEFIRVFYNLRMIRSLKGKINALRFVPNYIPAVLWKYMILKLSVADLESITSELYRATVKIVKLSNPLYASFLQDIDTRGDYQAYRRSLFMK